MGKTFLLILLALGSCTTDKKESKPKTLAENGCETIKEAHECKQNICTGVSETGVLIVQNTPLTVGEKVCATE